MKITNLLIIAGSLLCSISCNTNEKEYLNDAIDIIEENSIEKYTIDWDEFRSDVINRGREAKNIKETYPAIRYALNKLDDKHSRFKTLEERLTSNRPDRPIPEITSHIINNNIGYIQIPAFRGTDQDRVVEFALLIQSSIMELDSFNIENWILDLGNCTGGYVWPMMIGLCPLLGEGDKGYTVDADGKFSSWRIARGSVYYKNNHHIELKHSYTLRNRIKKLAIIISESTASAGEAIAISFKGAENTCFIGSRTYGVSTGTTGYELSDGAIIYVVNSKFADRNKNIYSGSIEPDIETSYLDATRVAINWIGK